MAAPSASASASSSASSATAAASGSAADGKQSALAPGPPVIRKLDEAVINRIAAGEVIHRPASALKELMENCLDAKATKITVTLKDGGLKVLQVQDNGHGIRVADFPVVCERFTTSKLKSYDDLQRIDTFGFRGEALASVTHVAHVSITSMTDAQTCAYKASFSDGKLVAAKPGDSAEPKPCAGVRGTTISAEDLFFNVPVRRQALKSSSDEYARCLEVVTKYAVHYTGVSFACKKLGAPKPDVHTLASATRLDTIRALYGAPVSRELLPFSGGSGEHEFTVDGLCSNANFNLKKLTLILFINNRLVDSTALRRAVETVYAAYLPKHTHPFVYLSLRMAGRHIDVNVHPTKKEVHFLFEEQVVTQLEQALERALAGANASRTFYTQSVLPGATAADLPSLSGSAAASATTGSGATATAVGTKRKATTSPSAAAGGGDEDGTAQPGLTMFGGSAAAAATGGRGPGGAPPTKRLSSGGGGGNGSGAGGAPVPEHKMVRTDNRTRKLDAYLTPVATTAATGPAEGATVAAPAVVPAGRRARVPPEERLSSVSRLLDDVHVSAHSGLSELFRGHTFVGCVDDTFALVQHKTKLYLVNVPTVSRAYFYEQMLVQFADVSRLRLSSPAPIRELVLMALDSPDGGWVEADGDKAAIAAYVSDVVCKHAPMLAEYFGIDVDAADGALRSLPNLLDRYIPPLAGLPLFLLRIGVDVDWTSEEACFRTLCNEIAAFYAVQPDLYLPPPPSAASSSAATASASSSSSSAAAAKETPAPETPLRFVVQHVLFPQLRAASQFHPPRALATDAPPSVTQVAALEQLYKIFERC